MHPRRPIALAVLALLAAPALAAAQEPTQQLRSAPREGAVIRVCADPDNLPASNQKGEGYENKIAELLSNPGIVRNRLKIRATVTNARAFLEVRAEFGSFDAYIWQFTGGKTLKNAWTSLAELPARTVESDAMSKDLLRRGFRFVGSTICYAHMQATGMVNDHTVDCFRYNEVTFPPWP